MRCSITILLLALTLPCAGVMRGQPLYTNLAEVYGSVTSYVFNAGSLPLGFTPQLQQYTPPPAVEAVWWSDRSGIKATLELTNFGESADAFIVPLSFVDIGRNELRINYRYIDGTVSNAVVPIYGRGFKFWTRDGSPLQYRVKAHLADLVWLSITNAATNFFGAFSAPEQYFWLPTNTACQFYSLDTLPSTVIVGEVTNITTNAPAMQPVPLPPGLKP